MHHIILYTTLLSTLIPTSHVAATLKSLTTATLLVDIQHGYCIVLFDDYRGLWVLPAAQRYSVIICTNGRVKNLLTRRRIYTCVIYIFNSVRFQLYVVDDSLKHSLHLCYCLLCLITFCSWLRVCA